MKLEWNINQLGDWNLLLNGAVVAGVGKTGETYFWEALNTMNGDNSDLDPAKAAAERAVLDWFRACLGEPVAWALMNDDGTICAFMRRPDPDDTCVTHLYALEDDDG